jgi:hypothetical protein
MPPDDTFDGSTPPASPAPRRRAATPAPITVALDERHSSLVAFTWRRHRWLIDRVERNWVVETGWWSDELKVSRSFSRVVAEGRVFDLCYDHLTRSWSLQRIVS